MPTETGTIDLKAQKAAHDNAAKTATNYITDITNSGIWVTPEDAKPVNGAAAATTSGWHIADALELWRRGVRMLKAYAESATETVMEFLDGTVSLTSKYEESAEGQVTNHKTTIGLENTYAEQFGISGVRAVVEYDETSGPMPGQIGSSSAGIYADAGTYDAEVSVNDGGYVTMRGSSITVEWPDGSTIADGTVDAEAFYTAVSGGALLFEGSYSSTYNSAITGLPDLTDYARLLVEYEDSTGRRGSVWVDPPTNGTLVGTIFGCTTTGGNSASGLVIRSKSYKIAATSIDTDKDNNNRYTYGKVTVSTSGGVTYANSQEIGIVRVIGYR